MNFSVFIHHQKHKKGTIVLNEEELETWQDVRIVNMMDYKTNLLLLEHFGSVC